MKLRIGVSLKNFESRNEFHENRCNDSLTLLGDVNQFIPVI